MNDDGSSSPTGSAPAPPPLHRGAARSSESVLLAFSDLQVRVYRRTTGWGWLELVRDDHLIAVLDHFGELRVRDQPVPMRLEADAFERIDEHRLRFTLASTDLAEALRGTSFDSWIGIPYAGPLLTGTLEIGVDSDGGVQLQWRLTSGYDITLDYLRGPWLRVPEQQQELTDEVLLPGVDWTIGREWTSGNDNFRDPWALRVTPPPVTVTAPIMAVHRGDHTVSLEWLPDQVVTGWFSLRRECPQPVLAAPNFIERRPGSLLGLMIPHVDDVGEVPGSRGLELHRGQRIELDAVVRYTGGSALDALTGWVQRDRPMDGIDIGRDPGPVIEQIAAAYADRYFHPGQGYGLGQTPNDISTAPPEFVRRYLERDSSTSTADRLRAQLNGVAASPGTDRQAVIVRQADEFLDEQQQDGSFIFDPEGRHRSKDDFLVARDLVAPMGTPGDTALDLIMVAALHLLEAAELTGDPRYADGARRALDFALDFHRPEGGDFWETPLHAPNLFAAGHAAVGYAVGHRLFGDDRYADRVRHWLRSLLAFTQLWQPRSGPEMIFNTKPCLCASDWYFAHWVRDHVQWEVLETFALADSRQIRLADFDTAIDWDRYRAGITWAAVRWLLDHRDDDWRPHNLPETIDAYRAGRFDFCLPDTHNATTGLYGGMAIMPGTVGLNLLALERLAASEQ